MSVQVFGRVLLRNQPHNLAWEYLSLDVGDVFTAPLNGATVTITGVTMGIDSPSTSIAYTVTGSFTAGPATLATFRGWLQATTLVRTSYRGNVAPDPQWPGSELDEAGVSSGELIIIK